MNRTSTMCRALLAGTIAITALVGAAGCGTSGHRGAGTMNHSSPIPSATGPTPAKFGVPDVQFVQMMIPHHQQAVEMATLAETRASDPELKQLAAQIKAAQDPEIKEMTGWLAAWGQPTAVPSGHGMPGEHGMPGMVLDADMARLRAANGVAFDRMFADLMIAHHSGAIEMARSEKTNGINVDAISLAAEIEQTQAAEIVKLQKILNRL
jgi:uncharacterized protein (DUF305 family)